jgi:hypothetical protein
MWVLTLGKKILKIDDLGPDDIISKVWTGSGKPVKKIGPKWRDINPTADLARTFQSRINKELGVSNLPKAQQDAIRINTRRSQNMMENAFQLVSPTSGQGVPINLPARIYYGGSRELSVVVPRAIREKLNDSFSSVRTEGYRAFERWAAEQNQEVKRSVYPWIVGALVSLPIALGTKLYTDTLEKRKQPEFAPASRLAPGPMTEFAPASRFDTGPTKPEFTPATRFDRGPQTQPKPRFTEEELSPYRKVAEPGFGQKIFGLRRSAPEIQRDATYNSLREQGLVEEANTFLETWNTQHKEKLDAALGDAGNLTQFTKDDPDRETSLREDVVSAAQKVKDKLPQGGPFKKGGRVKPRKKVMKKMYAKGGSVRKPKRIK